MMNSDSTKLNMYNQQHQLLIGILSMFIDDFNYHPRDLFSLMDNAKSVLWPSFMEMYLENKEKNKEEKENGKENN